MTSNSCILMNSTSGSLNASEPDVKADGANGNDTEKNVCVVVLLVVCLENVKIFVAYVCYD